MFLHLTAVSLNVWMAYWLCRWFPHGTLSVKSILHGIHICQTLLCRVSLAGKRLSYWSEWIILTYSCHLRSGLMIMLRGHLMLPVQCSTGHWMAQLKVAMILMWEVLVLFTSRWKNRWGTCGNLRIVMWMTWARFVILWKIKGYLIYGSLRLSLIMDITHCRYPGDKAACHCQITGTCGVPIT